MDSLDLGRLSWRFEVSLFQDELLPVDGNIQIQNRLRSVMAPVRVKLSD
jgi:hypothetical protein